MLYSEGCPGGEASARVLREALSETAPGTEVQTVELSSRAFFGPKSHPTVGMVCAALRERGVGSVAGR